MSNYNLDYIQNGLDDKLKLLLSKSSNDIELECIFNNKKYLTQEKYLNLLHILSLKSKIQNLKLINETSLDIAYQYKKENILDKMNPMNNINNVSNYRVTLIDLDNINTKLDDNLKKRHIKTI